MLGIFDVWSVGFYKVPQEKTKQKNRMKKKTDDKKKKSSVCSKEQKIYSFLIKHKKEKKKL